MLLAMVALLLAPVSAGTSHHRMHAAERCPQIGIMYVRCILKKHQWLR
jgi:hypothetical protein